MIDDSYYIDIHSHTRTVEDDVFTLNNILVNENENIISEKFYSVGIHPWYINEFGFDDYCKKFESYFKYPNFIAVGEIGLDKLRPNFEMQQKLFEKQLLFAQENNFPVIIHCVKAFGELLKIIDKIKFVGVLIFHRYGGNSQITENLLQRDSFFSFGHSLLIEKSNILKIFKLISHDRIFLETDDSNISIKEIYLKAALLRGISVRELKKMIFNNFIKSFKNLSI